VRPCRWIGFPLAGWRLRRLSLLAGSRRPDSEHEQGHERRQTDRLIARLRREAAVRDAQLSDLQARLADAERELDDLRAIRDALTPSVLPKRSGMRLPSSCPRPIASAATSIRRCGSPAPTGRRAQPTTRLPSCAPRSRPVASTPTPSKPCSAPPATTSRDDARPAGLTPREVEILGLLARGLSNKEIAARLVVSPKTVGKHVEHIYIKIDTSTRAAAGLFATQHGLLAEEEPAATATAWATERARSTRRSPQRCQSALLPGVAFAVPRQE
jgi:DNA-binding CsgD family transcriptional regulator